MIDRLKTRLERRRAQERMRRDYETLLALGDHLLRDTGLRREDVRARLLSLGGER